MHKTFAVTLFIVLGTVFFAGTGFSQPITSVNDLEGKLVAVPQGTLADVLVMETIPNTAVVYYEDAKACLDALKAGPASAAAYDEPVMRSLLRNYPDLIMLPEFITNDTYGLAVNLKNTELKNTMDKVIRESLVSGKLAEMEARWFAYSTDEPAPEPEVLKAQGQKVLRFGTAAVVEPFTFKNANGDIIGLDIELAGYIAQELGMRLQIVDMPFDEMIPALQAGKVDMIGACITISPNRKQMVLFSIPYYRGGIVAVVKAGQ